VKIPRFASIGWLVGALCVGYVSFARPSEARREPRLAPSLAPLSAGLSLLSSQLGGELSGSGASTQKLTINGVRVTFRTWNSDLSVQDVLKDPASCQGADAKVEVELAPGDVAGAATCRSEGPSPLGEVRARLSRGALDSGLPLLNGYTFAQRHLGGTSVVSVAFAGANLDEMFPVGADVPGGDPVGVPRPASSRRVLAAVADAGDHAVYLYDSELPSTSLRRLQHGAMESSGWQRERSADANSDAQLYVKSGREVVIFAEPKDVGAQMLILDLGRPGREREGWRE
jgi:hypothetical protein